MAKPDEFEITATPKAELKKRQNLSKSSSIMALPLLLLTIYPAHSTTTTNKSPNTKTDKPKVVSEPTSKGENNVPLIAKEKEIALKLGYDERVLVLIQKALKPTMGIIKSAGLKTEDLDFFQEPTSNEAPLLKEDRQNFEKIADEYPEIKPLTDKALERYSKIKPEINEYLETAENEEMGEEKAIELVKLRFSGKKLLPENMGTFQLSLKYRMPMTNGLPTPEVMEKLKTDLEKCGYRLSELREKHTEQKCFKTLEEVPFFSDSKLTALTASSSRKSP
jgi:hypothetical protein